MSRLPYWYREPIPAEDRNQYLKYDDCVKRLQNGELLTRQMIGGIGVARISYRVHFQNDRFNITGHPKTFEKLKKNGYAKSIGGNIFYERFSSIPPESKEDNGGGGKGTDGKFTHVIHTRMEM